MAAAVIAASVLLAGAWPWRTPHPRRAAAASVLGTGLGFYAGCWLLGLRPHWPPTDAFDRLLLILFPILIAIELAAAFAGRFAAFAWLPRILLAAGVARILLHHTVYIGDSDSPGTAQWKPFETWLILAGLAAILTVAWVAM